MVLGMSLSAFTTMHVAISLIAIASGIVVVLGMIAAARLNALTAIFLITTALTSFTGFFFPYKGVTPGIILGILSLIVLLPAFIARYRSHLAGRSRWVYVVCSVLALYFNVFVLIAQSFQKIPALHALAPTGSEAPFKITQLLTLVIFLVLGYLAVKKFHPSASSIAA